MDYIEILRRKEDNPEPFLIGKREGGMKNI